MKNEKTTALVRFVIFNDLDIDLEEISNIIGCKPTLAYHKNDIIRENLYRIDNAWEYSTGYIETLYIDNVLDELFEIINAVHSDM